MDSNPTPNTPTVPTHYGSTWNIELRRMVTNYSLARARKCHEQTGKLYVVAFNDPVTDVVNVRFENQWVGHDLFAENGTQVCSVSYELSERRHAIFMDTVVVWTYPDDSFHHLDEAVRIVEVSFSEDGSSARWTRTRDAETRLLTSDEWVDAEVTDTAPLYREIPTFGNWDSVRAPLPDQITAILR